MLCGRKKKKEAGTVSAPAPIQRPYNNFHKFNTEPVNSPELVQQVPIIDLRAEMDEPIEQTVKLMDYL